MVGSALVVPAPIGLFLYGRRGPRLRWGKAKVKAKLIQFILRGTETAGNWCIVTGHAKMGQLVWVFGGDQEIQGALHTFVVGETRKRMIDDRPMVLQKPCRAMSRNAD